MIFLSNNHRQKLTLSHGGAFFSKVELFKQVKEASVPIRNAQQIFLEPHTQQIKLIKNSDSGIHIIKPRVQKESRQMTSAAFGATKMLASQSLHILLFDFFVKAVQSPKKNGIVCHGPTNGSNDPKMLLATAVPNGNS